MTNSSFTNATLRAIEATSSTNFFYAPTSLYSPTNLITTFFEGTIYNQDIWYKYEFSGYNLLFLSICAFILFICCCLVCVVVVYNNQHKNKDKFHQYASNIDLTKTIHFATHSSMYSREWEVPGNRMKDLTEALEIVDHKSNDSDSNDSIINVTKHNSIKNSFELELSKLDETYKDEIKLPLYYYLTLFIHYISTLIEYVVVVYYIDLDSFNYIDILYLMWSYSILMSCCNIFNFCTITVECIQVILLLMLCSWSIDSLAVFLSIFIFQIITRCLLGIIDNNGDICDFELARASGPSSTERYGLIIGENVRIAIFGNLESIFLLYFNENTIFHTKSYFFCLVFMFWISSLSPDYIKYLGEFGEYFRPTKYFHHFVAAIYNRVQIMSGVLFRLFNVYYCILLLLNEDDSNDFEFGYSIFMILFSFLLLAMIPLFLFINRHNCCCGSINGCCKWFWCLKLEYEYIL